MSITGDAARLFYEIKVKLFKHFEGQVYENYTDFYVHVEKVGFGLGSGSRAGSGMIFSRSGPGLRQTVWIRRIHNTGSFGC